MKKEMNFKGTGVLILLVLALTLSLSLISAVGVANSYWDDKPLKLAPGESMTISLRLQNEEEEQITMGVFLDSQIASLADRDRYNVPPDRTNVPVYIDVEIPEDAKIGEEYTIIVSFKQESSGEGGMLRLSKGITGKVPVEVVGEQDSEIYSESEGISTNTIIMIVALVIIAFLIIISTHARKKKK